MKAEKKYTALVTGGTRGIGREVCLDLARNFTHTLFINYVQNDVEAELTKSMVEESGCKVFLLKRNMAFPDEIDKMFDEIYSVTKTLDMFVHCPAINSFKPLIKVKPNQWDITMNVNARSFLHCVQKCLPVMKTGQIVAVSSLGSRTYVPNYGSMGPTKSALESIVRYLAAELAGSGIRVNGVTAGFVQTDSLTKFPDSEKMIEESLKRTPAKRIGNVKDISNTVLFY
ncbi:MAG: SDR family oxidoreductase [Ignavibacteria bacterium]|nr:SDR family oxidoreductase [Ignavibacteria bacterium]